MIVMLIASASGLEQLLFQTRVALLYLNLGGVSNRFVVCHGLREGSEGCYLTAGYERAALAVPWETVLPDFNFYSNEFR